MIKQEDFLTDFEWTQRDPKHYILKHNINTRQGTEEN